MLGMTTEQKIFCSFLYLLTNQLYPPECYCTIYVRRYLYCSLLHVPKRGLEMTLRSKIKQQRSHQIQNKEEVRIERAHNIGVTRRELFIYLR
jgi:hypothetical protein